MTKERKGMHYLCFALYDECSTDLVSSLWRFSEQNDDRIQFHDRTDDVEKAWNKLSDDERKTWRELSNGDEKISNHNLIEFAQGYFGYGYSIDLVSNKYIFGYSANLDILFDYFDECGGRFKDYLRRLHKGRDEFINDTPVEIPVEMVDVDALGSLTFDDGEIPVFIGNQFGSIEYKDNVLLQDLVQWLKNAQSYQKEHQSECNFVLRVLDLHY